LTLLPSLNLLYLDLVLFLPRLTRLARLLVFVFPVIHDSDDGRARHRRHFHQVEPTCGGRRPGVFYRDDPHLLAFMIDQPDWAYANLVVYAGLVSVDNRSPFI
jgi:hypothetical protein